MSLDINKQKMIYAVKNKDKKIPVFKLNKDGSIKYIDIDGRLEPVETGEYTTGYERPVVFYSSISNKLSETLMKEFGIDNSTNFVQIVADKERLPLKIGTLIWKKSEVRYKDKNKTLIDDTSCDYIVKGIADEGLTVDLFLLQKNIK